MSGRIRQTTLQKICWMLVGGNRDAANHAVSVRLRTSEDLGAQPIADFLSRALEIVQSKALALA